jgi:hypothetical protein
MPSSEISVCTALLPCFCCLSSALLAASTVNSTRQLRLPVKTQLAEAVVAIKGQRALERQRSSLTLQVLLE